MSKKVIVQEKEVTCQEIIKIGPKIGGFDDNRRNNALKNSFGKHIKYFEGPKIGSDDFVAQLHEQIRSLSDLAALEVSTDLEEIDIRLIIEKSLGTLVIQPQFSNTVFLRYISFGLGELTVQPIDFSISSN
jgi:hypothetical protein